MEVCVFYFSQKKHHQVQMLKHTSLSQGSIMIN